EAPHASSPRARRSARDQSSSQTAGRSLAEQIAIVAVEIRLQSEVFLQRPRREVGGSLGNAGPEEARVAKDRVPDGRPKPIQGCDGDPSTSIARLVHSSAPLDRARASSVSPARTAMSTSLS